MKTLFKLSFSFLITIFLSGTVLAQTAELQVIHNAADPAATNVDVYVNGTLALDDFAFRTATPFLTLPAGVVLNIGVAPANSTSVNDTLVNFTVTLTPGQRYIAVANGVLNPSGLSVNPDGIATAFTLLLKDNIQNAAMNGSEVDFVMVHGATDAPTVDVIARNVATIVDDAAYTDITSYISVPANNYLLDITPAAGSPIIASYTADLTLLGGGSAVVFASGFLNPSSNMNGPAFGLFAALANGTVVALPQTSVARLQVIHNAADPAAALVDVYVNGSLLLDDFGFRTATPFIDVPADVLLNIGVAGNNSTSVNDTLKNFQVTLVNGESYVAIANGVLNPSAFAANPNAVSTAFTLFLQDDMREEANTSSEVDFRVVHGATDAPTVDVIAQGVATLVDDASYSDITNYINVPAASYVLNITPGNDNSVIVASFIADLTSLAGGSAVVLASGFLNPAANQNGAPFGLIAVLTDGTVLPLSVVTGIKENNKIEGFNLYPNPARDKINLEFVNKDIQNSIISITDIYGKELNTFVEKTANDLVTINTSGYNSGVYLINVLTEENTITRKFIVD